MVRFRSPQLLILAYFNMNKALITGITGQEAHIWQNYCWIRANEVHGLIMQNVERADDWKNTHS